MKLLQRAVGRLLVLLFLAGTLVFASLLLVVLVAAGIVLGGWMWWRSRGLRRSGGRAAVVVEGEFRDVTPARRIEGRDSP